jgi:hypothetical protein
MRALLFSIATAVVTAAGALYGCDRLENPQREYPTLTEEVFLGGWVPRLLPPTATAIRTQHNIDTNEVWVRFKTGAADFDPTKLGFSDTAQETWPTSVRQPRYASWWFSSLTQFKSSTARLYTGLCGNLSAGAPVRSGHMLVAAGEAYLWCGGESAA